MNTIVCKEYGSRFPCQYQLIYYFAIKLYNNRAGFKSSPEKKTTIQL